MNIWVIKEGEPLPIDGQNGRIMRCGIICRMLAEQGHKVLWWSSTFSHQTKKKVRSQVCTEEISENYQIRLLDSSTVYKKNISFQRVIYNKEIANQFQKESETLIEPDIILCSYPTIDFAYAALRYGKKRRIPVVVDVRDLWPDIFTQPFPFFLKPFIHLAFFKYFKMSKQVIQDATAIIGVTPYVMDWVRRKGRIITELDHTVFLAYDLLQKNNEIKIENDFWKSQNIKLSDNIICYFGNIIDRIDFNTVFKAAQKLCKKNIPVKFVICGTGSYLNSLEQKTKKLGVFFFPGYINQVQIEELMNISIAGIIPYFNSRSDFVDAVPNKAIEYLAGGLPVISSLQGFLKNILSEYNCGLSYNNSNELAKDIELLILKKDEVSKMKGNARKLYQGKFTAKRVYGDLCVFLETLSKTHKFR